MNSPKQIESQEKLANTIVSVVREKHESFKTQGEAVIDIDPYTNEYQFKFLGLKIRVYALEKDLDLIGNDRKIIKAGTLIGNLDFMPLDASSVKPENISKFLAMAYAGFSDFFNRLVEGKTKDKMHL